MSTGFNILLSPPSEGFHQPIEVFKKLLTVILQSPNIGSESGWFKIYSGQRPFDLGSNSNDRHVIFQLPLGKRITPQKLFEVIDSVQSDDIYVGASFAYERREWNNDTCDSEPSLGSVIVEYEAPTFDGGYRNKQLGPYHVLFDERKYFSPYAMDLSRCPANSPEALLKLMRYGQNIEFPKGLFKQIAAGIKPQHQVLVTEGERVNPLNSHMVYHRELSGFLFDAQKILQLHNYGGGYFYEGRDGDFDAPFNSLRPDDPRYGDYLIRFREPAEELEKQLDFFSTILGVAGLRDTSLEDAEIFKIITSSDDLEFETIYGGMCVASPRFIFGYLDALYLKLLDAAASKKIAKN